MARWEKLLARMQESVRCVGFTYVEATLVLQHLGFEVVPWTSGSHRHWSKLLDTQERVIIGLVDSGHGVLKPVYIKKMLRALEHHQLITPRET